MNNVSSSTYHKKLRAPMNPRFMLDLFYYKYYEFNLLKFSMIILICKSFIKSSMSDLKDQGRALLCLRKDIIFVQNLILTKPCMIAIKF